MRVYEKRVPQICLITVCQLVPYETLLFLTHLRQLKPVLLVQTIVAVPQHEAHAHLSGKTCHDRDFPTLVPWGFTLLKCLGTLKWQRGLTFDKNLSSKGWLTRMLPRQKPTSVSALAVTFLECPAMFEAFQANKSIKAAPKVPLRYDANRRTPLFLGTPSGSRPYINPAATIVGMRQISMTRDRSFHRSLKYPESRTTKIPTAPEGMFRISACWLV